MLVDATAGLTAWLPVLSGLLGGVVGGVVGAAILWAAVRATARATTRATAQAIVEGQRAIAQELLEGQRAVGHEVVDGHRAVAHDTARRQRRARQVQGALDLAERRLAAYMRLRRAASAFDGAVVRAVADQLHGEQTLLGEGPALGAFDERVREAAEAFAEADAQCESAIKGFLVRGDLPEVATTIGHAMPGLLAAVEGLHRAAEAYIFGK